MVRLLEWLKIDDPVESSHISMGCGFVGVILTGFFHTEYGIFYSHKPNESHVVGGKFLGV
jgi:ammonia channel protein AmtB